MFYCDGWDGLDGLDGHGKCPLTFFRGPINLYRIFHLNLKAISIFWSTFFEGIFLVKLKLISFFNARYLTVSLRGPVLNLTARAKPEL